MNIRFILYVLGALLMIEGGLMLFPALVSLIYGEPDLPAFLLSSLITVVTGGAFWLFGRGASREINSREGYIIVSTVWVLFALFGSLPFLISGEIHSISDAFFEAMSGFTTTGATILRDIEALPHGLLFWRAFMHFIGGMGILVLGIAILPIFGVGSMMIYHAETSNASISSRLSPRIKDTAKYISRIYIFFTIICTLLYIPEMGFFDAICHSFSTTASGGFSTKNASMGAYSAYSQYVSVFFMLLAGTNFTLLYFVWKRDFRKVLANDEFKFYLLIVLLATIFISCGLLYHDFKAEQAIRESLFHVVSILTTTGYVISDYTLWFPPLWFIIFLIAFIGGSAGSTAGGLKVVRFVLLFKMIPVQFKRIVHQRGMIQVKLNKQNVPEDQMFRTLSFFMIFLCVFTAATFLLMISGLDFTSSVGASIACLGNSGPGLELVGPAGNFGGVSIFGKWVCSFLMLFGRLELYAVLVLFTHAFWTKQ